MLSTQVVNLHKPAQGVTLLLGHCSNHCCPVAARLTYAANAVQDLMREELRRKAAESQVSSITIERDTFQQECARLKIKLLAQEVDSTRLRLEQDQGCERQPQCPGTHDRPHVSAVTDVITGQPCTINLLLYY